MSWIEMLTRNPRMSKVLRRLHRNMCRPDLRQSTKPLLAKALRAKGQEPKAQRYNSRLPSMALSMVISSVYSMSLPTGMPIAMRVTFTPTRLSCCER